MHRFIFRLALIALVAATASGCAGFPGRHDDSIRNPSLEILAVSGGEIPKTGNYTWGPHYFRVQGEQAVDLAKVDQRIRSAITKELHRRGFDEGETDPDLIVSFSAGLNAELDENAINEAYGDQFKASFPALKKSRVFNKGALVIDVLDAKTHKLYWRGTILADLDMKVDDKTKDRRVRAGVRALLDQFPVPRTAS